MKCYECQNGELQKTDVDYFYHGINLGRFPAEVCPKCGAQFFSEEASRMIEEAAKKAGVWGLCATTRVGRSGNSLDILISNRLARFVGLQKGSEVMIHPDGKKKLIVELV